MIRYICDRCGNSDSTVSRFVMSLAVAAPHKTEAMPKFDGELCANCLADVWGKIDAALKSARR